MAAPAAIHELRQRMARLASAQFRAEALQTLAEEARTQIVEGFRNSRSPYGERWASLKYREGQPLRDTGRLLNALMPKPTATGIRIQAPLVYAATHQYGRGPIPQRQFLPEQSQGLGPIWTRAFRRALESALRRTVEE